MKNRFVILAGFSLALLQVPSAFGTLPGKTAPLPHFDKRETMPAKAAFAPATAQLQAEANLASRVPSVRISRDKIVGTPRFISTSRGFLTGPQGEGASIGQNTLLALPLDDPHRVVKAFINEHSAVFGHDASVLAGAQIRTDATAAHNGLRTVIWQQTHQDVPVFEALVISHLTRYGELVSVSDRFVPDIVRAAASASASQAISVNQAIVAAAANAGGTANAAAFTFIKTPVGADKRQTLKTDGLAGPVWAQLVWLPMDRDSARLCWQVVFNTRPQGYRYLSLVDAETAEVLVRRNLTIDLKNATYNVYTNDSPSPLTPGYPAPTNAQPPTVSRTLVTLSALDTNASPLGWIPDTGMTTSGNNTEAFLDRDGNYDPDGLLPNGGANRVFDFPLDLTTNPRLYANASVVQMFYRANWYHDRTYQLGFTEAYRNYQVDNLGRGGIGDDPVICLTQAGADAGYSDNAFFQPAPDGIPGYVAMFTWNGPNPDRDGALDSEVVLHELTHGLSTRLLGGGVGIYQLQPEGMGEGWSDFYALCLLSESSDDPNAPYPVAAYVAYDYLGFDENYYYGLRRYPYSTDLAVNPLTLKDIDPTQADPHIGIPTNPVIGGGRADEVHNMGEVWCAILWEVRASLVQKLGWDEGNELALQLVTDGLKLAPENANYVEARDGIIQADSIYSGGSQYDDLWIAFAKRGLGFSAQCPTSDTSTGVNEAFDLPPDVIVGVPDGILELKITPTPGSLLFTGDTNNFFVRVKDADPVTNATVTATMGSVKLTFRNDGKSPDAFANDNTYSTVLNTPTNETSITVTVVVTATNKITATNIVTYYLIPTPRNDNFANADKVPGSGTNYFTSNRKATMEKGEPNHGGLATAAASLWWSFVPLTDGEVLVDTGGSEFVTVIGVYTNSALTNLQAVASALGSTSTGGRQGAYLRFNAKAGIPYRIAIASADSRNTGTLRLKIATGGQPDMTGPVASITGPPSGLTVTTNRISVTGTAVDVGTNASGIRYININVSTTPGVGEGVTTTVYPQTSFDGPVSTNWVATVALRAGLNRITVTAFDYAGNRSTGVRVDVVYRILDPINDFFVNARVWTNATGVDSVNTVRATKEIGEPNHAGVIGGKSAWWSFTPPADGVLTLTTTNSSFDTVLAVYTGNKVNALTPVGANDDAWPGVTGGFSMLAQPVRSNLTYHVAVDGYDGLSGVVFLGYSFAPASLYRLDVSSGPGGTVTPGSMDVQSNATIVVSAVPSPSYQFQGWEGSVVSAVNPLAVTVTNNLTLSAKFGLIPVTDGFESGGFTTIPWVNGAKPWIVQTNSVAAGSYAARSGAIGNSETSSLSLTTKVRAGTGSFSYRVSTEQGWDWFSFYVDGLLVQQWSGEVGWSNFGFPVTEGTHTFEWRYAKDNLGSAGEDAAFIDNVNLPIGVVIDPSIPIRLTLTRLRDGTCNVDLTGQDGVSYVLESSGNLRDWTGVSTNTAAGGTIRFVDQPGDAAARYYRARTE